METRTRRKFTNVKALMLVAIVFAIAISKFHENTMNNLGTTPPSLRSYKDQEVPEVLPTDLIYSQARSVFVIPEYKLIFFTFPKVRKIP